MKIAVSACLLGEKIRFDGGHKHDRFITEELSRFAEFVPFCPEHLAFGTPRPSIRLLRLENQIYVHSNKDDTDLTERLIQTSRDELSKIAHTPLSGIIFKSKSPSCGMKSAKTYLDNGFCEGKEDGIFASMCRERYPLLPMEEEGRLQDAWLRENFVMQLFAYDAYEQFKASFPTVGDLVRFHTCHKFLLQAKDEQLYRELGNIVANRDALKDETLLAMYELGFKTAISRKSSIKRTRNVLEHMAGFFKNDLTKSEKEILHEQINDFTDKIIPLIVPLSTIALYAQKYDIRYLLDQTFLNPYPKTLALRSHIDAGK
ncbi:YbgA family protein [Sulfuricurvum sp.]|uniref:YbgA family protein n=1 Tax=Sulfuricurvum sp. TaxID=2025608 RepID=UPI003BAF7A45